MLAVSFKIDQNEVVQKYFGIMIMFIFDFTLIVRRHYDLTNFLSLVFADHLLSSGSQKTANVEP